MRWRSYKDKRTPAKTQRHEMTWRQKKETERACATGNMGNTFLLISIYDILNILLISLRYLLPGVATCLLSFSAPTG